MDLLSCELDRDAGAVVARWRMGYGAPLCASFTGILFPWRQATASFFLHWLRDPLPTSLPKLDTHTHFRIGVLRRGDLDFFWRPRVELTGCTRFFYDAKRGGRVVRYRETWDIGAGEALMQLVRPGRHRGDRGKAAAAE